MRLKKYLNKRRSQIISKDKTLDILHSKCKDALKAYKNGNIIYRGLANDIGNFAQISPSKFNRVSTQTDNYYTLINDNSPAWAKYPKRSKSIICTTDYNTAYFYGYSYVVFPYDSAKIGKCIKGDYWWSFPFVTRITNIGNVSGINDNINMLFRTKEIKDHVGDIDSVRTYSDLQKLFRQFDAYVKENDKKLIEKMKQKVENNGIEFKEPDHSPTINYLHNIPLLEEYDEFMNLEKYLQYLLDPKRNKFELIKITDDISGDHEVWTDSDSILIKEEIIRNVL